jgi:hypothetical protein
MPQTTADELFERYLRGQGYEPGSHEPDLSDHGISERPDFLPSFCGLQIACEVKQFNARASSLERRLTLSDGGPRRQARSSVQFAARFTKGLAS